jgi:hypothetical protein
MSTYDTITGQHIRPHHGEHLYLKHPVKEIFAKHLFSQPLLTMKSLILSLLATQASAHAIWQDLWVNGVDKGNTCVRLPGTSYVSNSPVTVQQPRLNSGLAILTP